MFMGPDFSSIFYECTNPTDMNNPKYTHADE